jgi:hypothetical protein
VRERDLVVRETVPGVKATDLVLLVKATVRGETDRVREQTFQQN